MKTEIHIFEPTKEKEYIDVLKARTGHKEKSATDETRQYVEEIYSLFGHSWAACHSRVSLQNELIGIINECTPDSSIFEGVFKSKMPNHIKLDILNIAWDIFKSAWINADEYIVNNTTKKGE